MTLRICFAAGDVGGARAILPVARLAAAKGIEVLGLDHGIFRTEGDDDWQWLSHAQTFAAEFDVLIYATSVSDQLAFQTALAANERGRTIIHVLDNWSQYESRLHGLDITGTHRELIPDAFCVMDELAWADAIADGVPPEILHITGHPGLASLDDEKKAFRNHNADGGHILFVSEPVVQDSGDHNDPNGRGYDEVQVSASFAKALMKRSQGASVEVHVAPHPREDRETVHARWATYASSSGLNFRIVPRDEVRLALQGAHCVVGMSSLLLYESWLLGHPTLSLQPNLRLRQLAQLGRREGIELCTDPAEVDAAVQRLMAATSMDGAGQGDMAIHKDASSAVLFCAESSYIK